MASKPNLYPYVLYYKDQTFQTINITKADYENVSKAVLEGKHAVKISIGTLDLADFRSLLERIDPPQEKEAEKAETKYEGLTMEEAAYLWEQEQQVEALRKRNEMEVDYQ